MRCQQITIRKTPRKKRKQKDAQIRDQIRTVLNLGRLVFGTPSKWQSYNHMQQLHIRIVSTLISLEIVNAKWILKYKTLSQLSSLQMVEMLFWSSSIQSPAAPCGFLQGNRWSWSSSRLLQLCAYFPKTQPDDLFLSALFLLHPVADRLGY